MLSLSLLFLLFTSSAGAAGNKADVIVIGAGVSGLAAARTLVSEGLSVIVLEAQNRIGGRIKTSKDYFGGQTIELGAQWIHGYEDNPMTDFLLNDVNDSTYFVTNYENSDYFDVSTLLTEAQMNQIWSDYDRVAGGIVKLQDSEFDAPLSDSISYLYERYGYTESQQRYTNFAVIDEIESEYAASCENLSTWWYDSDFSFGGEDWWMAGGYDQIPNYLATGLDIRLNQRVNSIDISGANLPYPNFDQRNITISTTAGTVYESSFVIVTIPLGILKKGNITFTPQLHESVQHAIDTLYMGLLEKNFVWFDDAFWATNRDFIYVMDDGESRYNISRYLEFFNIEYYQPGSNLMCVFDSGDSAFNSELLSDEERLNNLMARLRQVYPAAPDPQGYLFTNWAKDEFTYGSYSAYGLGSSPADRAAFRQSYGASDGSYNSLFFAGEHSSLCYPSTTSGAYLSGVNAANILLGKPSDSLCGGDSSSDSLSIAWIIGFSVIGFVGCSCFSALFYYFWFRKRWNMKRQSENESLSGN
jgi:monoamine oxidase